jgi:hypothetical protein
MTTATHRGPADMGHEDRRPWVAALGVLATLVMASTVATAALVTYRVAPALPAVGDHATAVATVVTVVLGGLAIWTVTRAWHTGGLVDHASDVLDALLFAISVAALFTHHPGGALLIWASRLAYSAVTAFPEHPLQYLQYAWWTPLGAYRRGQAHAALDTVAHAQNLLTDPRLDGATATQLVTVLAHDARAIAADAMGDARDLQTIDHRTICSVCGTSTREAPCPTHQPFLRREQVGGDAW